jgi:hypothetical protein
MGSISSAVPFGRGWKCVLLVETGAIPVGWGSGGLLGADGCASGCSTDMLDLFSPSLLQQILREVSLQTTCLFVRCDCVEKRNLPRRTTALVPEIPRMP